MGTSSGLHQLDFGSSPALPALLGLQLPEGVQADAASDQAGYHQLAGCVYLQPAEQIEPAA